MYGYLRRFSQFGMSSINGLLYHYLLCLGLTIWTSEFSFTTSTTLTWNLSPSMFLKGKWTRRNLGRGSRPQMWWSRQQLECVSSPWFGPSPWWGRTAWWRRITGGTWSSRKATRTGANRPGWVWSPTPRKTLKERRSNRCNWQQTIQPWSMQVIPSDKFVSIMVQMNNYLRRIYKLENSYLMSKVLLLWISVNMNVV